MPPSSPGSRLEIALAALALGFVAWVFACIVNVERERPADDAFITFIYARNVVEGHGLRYNPSDAEPTSGASSLLHVGLCAAAISVGLEPLAFTRALSIASLLVLALALAFAAARITRAPPAACVLAGTTVVFLWGLLPESTIHFGSGLETLLFASVHGCVVAWIAWCSSDDRPQLGTARILSGLGLLVLLAAARPEGTWLALGYLVVLAYVRRPRGSLASGVIAVAPLAGPFLVLALAYAIWRISYFGDFFDNPYYVKVSNAIFGSSAWLPGLDTTGRFLVMRVAPLTLLAIAMAAAVGASMEAVRRAFWLALPALAVLLLYARVIHEMAGGYRYEYGLLAPFAGAFTIGLCALRRRSPASFFGAIACGGIALPLLASSAAPQITEWLVHPRSSASRWWPDYWPSSGALARLGFDLSDTGLGERATILLSGAGQVPYYSRLRAIDWIGLNHNPLAGREPMTIEEMWRYIDGLQPDLAFSILPPAAPGSTRPDQDPNFLSEHVQRTLEGRGSALFVRWDRARVAESFWREMLWLRDSCEFAACYQLGLAWGDDWWVLVYVRRDSPHRDRLMEVFAQSPRVDRDVTLDKAFPFDPRGLGKR